MALRGSLWIVQLHTKPVASLDACPHQSVHTAVTAPLSPGCSVIV
jgi:hypothetical protein